MVPFSRELDPPLEWPRPGEWRGERADKDGKEICRARCPAQHDFSRTCVVGNAPVIDDCPSHELFEITENNQLYFVTSKFMALSHALPALREDILSAHDDM